MTATTSKFVPVSLLALALAASPALAQKKTSSTSMPLTIVFADNTLRPGDELQNDVNLLAYPADTSSSPDGAFLNSVDGIELKLVPGSKTADPDRYVRFSFASDVGQPGDACYLPANTGFLGYSTDLRVNVVDSLGNPVGVESMTIGQSVVGNPSGGYGVGGIVNFTPDRSFGTSTVTNVVLHLGQNPGFTIYRYSSTTWTVTGSGDFPVQCTVLGAKNRNVTYDMGNFHLDFQFTAVKR